MVNVAWLDAGRVFGFGRALEEGIVIVRLDAEARERKRERARENDERLNRYIFDILMRMYGLLQVTLVIAERFSSSIKLCAGWRDVELRDYIIVRLWLRVSDRMRQNCI